MRVGWFRLRTVWPFPVQQIRKLADSAAAFVVPEINLGQMCLEVERCAQGRARVLQPSHAGGGVLTPESIVDAILEAAP